MSFTEGRLGGSSADFPFTFKVSLKRALLTVRLEAPLEIDRKTVARGVPSAEVELSKILGIKSAAKSNTELAGKLSPATFHLAATGAVASEDCVTQEEQIKIVQSVPEILVSPIPGDARSYSWELQPSYRETLKGQPWNPVDSPRFRLKSLSNTSPLPPTITVEVTCALEDLDISDLQPKDRGVMSNLKSLVLNEVSEAAAIQHLKLILHDANLEPGHIDNRFASLLIANILAIPE
ncbi:MAG TPA: hypothetical protein VF759_14140 [Allosphingosinicella sp.]